MLLPLDSHGVREALRKEVALVAHGQLGYVEATGNRTQYGKDYGLDGFPWCAMYVTWVYKQAAKNVGCVNPLPKYAHVTSSFERFKKLGMVIGENEQLLQGDLTMWDHDEKPGGPGHTGVIIQVHNGRSLFVSEGNTSRTDKSSRNGGEVCEHAHRKNDHHHGRLLGIVRPTRRLYFPLHTPGV